MFLNFDYSLIPVRTDGGRKVTLDHIKCNLSLSLLDWLKTINWLVAMNPLKHLTFMMVHSPEDSVDNVDPTRPATCFWNTNFIYWWVCKSNCPGSSTTLLRSIASATITRWARCCVKWKAAPLNPWKWCCLHSTRWGMSRCFVFSQFWCSQVQVLQ